MKGDRIAVIDLGSNTFHLLICELQETGWTELQKERVYVKLASGGMNCIDEDSQQRAIDAMIRFMNLIAEYEVKETRAIGTAALREAENGLLLAEKLESITGIPIEIIDGDEEAHYILQGIQAVMPNLDRPALIIDIGGGSVEFILYSEGSTLYARSFKIGMAVLFRKFHHSDPIQSEEIKELENFLGKELQDLFEELKRHPAYFLIGASGAFEVLRDELDHVVRGGHWAELDMKDIEAHLEKVIASSLEERKAMPEIPVERLDYIVVAYLLIRYITRKSPPERLYYCDFALKEGVIASMINLD